MKFSSRITAIRTSLTSATREVAKQKAKEGHKVINLAAGELQVSPPEKLLDAVRQVSSETTNLYVDAVGIKELREILARYLNQNGLKLNYKNVAICNGAKHALFNIIQSLVDADDEVILIEPCWNTYVNQVLLCGGKVKAVDSSLSNYEFSAASILNLVTRATKLIIITTPNNPTGKNIHAIELAKLAASARIHDIPILLDICYHRFIFKEDRPSFFSIVAKYPDLFILVDSLSKAFAITGWRVGYIAASESLIEKIKALQSHTSSNVNSLVQYAFVNCGELQTLHYFSENYKKTILSNLKIALSLLKDAPNITTIVPDGGFYLFCLINPGESYRTLSTNNDLDFVNKLLLNTGVAVTPASVFGAANGFRLSLCGDVKALTLGIKRLVEYFKV